MVLLFPELISDTHGLGFSSGNCCDSDARRLFAAVVISNFMKLTRELRENFSIVDIHAIK